jgi:hypothetical protein
MTKVSELLMIATAIGKDRFYPAIKINGYTYVLRMSREYTTREDAVSHSENVLTEIKQWVRNDKLLMWNR